jgi:hypothetical protein
MVTASRLRSSVVLLGLPILLGGAGQPAPETAQPADPACAATGYLVGSADERAALRGELVEQPVQQLAGVPLASGQTWVVPDGSQPVVMIDSTAPLPGGTVSVALAGREFEVDSVDLDEPGNRFVTSVALPHLGPTVRSLGLIVDSGPCQVALELSVDRSLWSTMVGAAAVAGTVLFGLLTVWVARLRKGGWARRFGFAAPLGLLAGTGQGVVLMESGVVSPFATPPWWAPVAGLALAALLPLTRWRRRKAAAVTPPPGEVPTVPQPPAHAPLGGYQVDAPFTITEVAAVYRAANDEGGRALLKLLLPERYGDPAARLRLEREARALSGSVHPNLLQLQQTVSDEGGPPTLVFEDVAGAPLRQLLDGGGTLTGQQAVNVVLGVLSGLRAVHERELVHRDVRPENVWLDTGGRVLVAGFELAATGVEHPLAPEGVVPYASPEQRAGQVLDGRSDLWACGMLLAELLIGRPAFPPPEALPEPLAAVLARALAEDPAGRPASARRFSADLWEAAEQVYGTDWVGRGALAGALVAHGAVGAATAGYALGGGAAGAGAVGAGAGVAAAGVGGAAGTALGAATTAGLGGTETGTLGAAAAATAPVAPVVPAGTTGGSPVGAVLNAAVAVVAGIAIAAGAALVDPEPAEARAVVITPDQARVIFVRTMAEGWSDTFTHFAEVAEAEFQSLLEVDESLAEGELLDIGVGVPREQYGFPAWFVAWALIPFEDGTASVFARFDRESAGEPWLMTTLGWSTERLLPAAEVDEDGWLAPAPDPADLLVDPASLPERYHDWLVRANEAGEIGSDDVLELRFDDTGMIVWFTDELPFFSGEDTGPFSYEYEMSVGEVVTDLIPLVDGTVHVTFTSIIRQTTYNTPNQRATSCAEYSLFWDNRDPPGRFRWLAQDLVAKVEAWIPVVGAVPEPTPAPTPTATPTPDPEAEPRLEPVDPDTIVIEDWNYESDNRDGDPC